MPSWSIALKSDPPEGAAVIPGDLVVSDSVTKEMGDNLWKSLDTIIPLGSHWDAKHSPRIPSRRRQFNLNEKFNFLC